MACWRREGNSPIEILSSEGFRTEKDADDEARELAEAYKGSDVKFFQTEGGMEKKSVPFSDFSVESFHFVIVSVSS